MENLHVKINFTYEIFITHIDIELKQFTYAILFPYVKLDVKFFNGTSYSNVAVLKLYTVSSGYM